MLDARRAKSVLTFRLLPELQLTGYVAAVPVGADPRNGMFLLQSALGSGVQAASSSRVCHAGTQDD